MKFHIGDSVRFLNETGGGKITRLDNKGLVYVLTDDGFEIPVRENELIFAQGVSAKDSTPVISDQFPASPDFIPDRGRERLREPEKAEDRIPANLPAGTPVKILLGLVPDDLDAVFKASVHLYIINDSAYFCFYRVGYQQQGKYYFLKSGELEADTKCFVADFDQAALGKIARFHVQALPVSKGQYFRVPVVDEEMDMTPFDFRRNHMYKPNDYFDERALIPGVTPLFGPNQAQPESHEMHTGETPAPGEKDRKSGFQGSDTLEVDLHIEALRDDYSGLTNGEILRIQMATFRMTLEEAINKKCKRIVFIHGVGNGTLRYELRNELKRNYPEFTWQDASFKEYGFGATMVHLR